MRSTIILAAVLVAASLVQAQTPSSSPNNYEFTNGKWFDGQKFVARTFYSVGGRLTDKKPAKITRVVDLLGKFVVPPFGEAHNHNLDWSSDERFDRVRRMYLEGGIFYVKNPNSLLRSRKDTLARINIPTSVDGVLSNGGLTGAGGHPIEIVSPQRGFRDGDGEGGFYFVIDSQEDLDRKWSTIIAGKPDFIKTYLLYSEEFDKRKNDKAYDGWKGLDPKLLPAIVRRAHGDGLRVSTHVETAADFHYALLAGADEINHMPGFRPDKNDVTNFTNLSRYEISEADARLAARKHVIVVTTLGETIEWILHGKEKAEDRAAVRAMLTHNLQILKKHGVPIAVGSDSFRGTSVAEAISLSAFGVFDNLTLLKMWCETTAATIFPKRRIGHLKRGYEASFLVLDGDPLQDFANVKKINVRFKDGELLSFTP